MGDGIKRAFAATSVTMLRSQIERAAKRGQGTKLTSGQVELVHKLIQMASGDHREVIGNLLETK